MAKNINGKGRGAEPRHVRLYHSITGTDAWRDLSGNAVKVLVAILRFDRGGDNGALFMSSRTAAAETGLTKNTAHAALRELEDHGFIAPTEQGHFSNGGGLATKWRVTWQAVKGVEGVPNTPPTRDFERWCFATGNKTPSQILTTSVPKIGTVLETFPTAVPKIGTGSTETSGVSNGGPVPEIGTQVVSQGRSDQQTVSKQRKQANSTSGVSNDLIGDELLDGLRQRVRSYLHSAGIGSQSRLAEASNMPGGTLSKFLGGKGLNRTHFIALQLELNRRMKEAA